MRLKIVKQIFKKEMIDILRDKKTIFMMVFLPIILYPVMMILFSQIMTASVNNMTEKELPIAIKGNIDSELVTMINNNKNSEDSIGKIKIVKVTDYEKAINDETIAAYIEVSKENTQYNIYTNSSMTDSYNALDRIENVLEDYKQKKVTSNLIERELDVEKTLEPIKYNHIDIAKNEEVAGSIIGKILPFILVISILIGTIYPAIDVMAGEKERGTLETLLTLPISNLELIMGKYLAVSSSAITTAIFNILSISLTLVYLFTSSGIDSNEFGLQSMNISKLIFPLIVTIICVCLFAMVISAISMCICSLAKSFKDAQNYITPIMMIVMMISYVSIIPSIVLDKVTATMPVVNISLLIRSVLSFKIDIQLIMLVLVSNIIFTVLSVILLSKMFNSEEILFGSNANFSLLEKRSNIKKGTMPNISDGLILYAISLLMLIYIGSIIQIKFKLYGLVATQIILLGLPMLFAYYIKSDFKKVFNIKTPKINHIIGGIILWIGGFILINIVNQILLNIFPQSNQFIEDLGNTLYTKNLFKNILIMALIPAICEEALFRGFIFKSFINKNSSNVAIICSAILFGIIHIDFLRIIPTGILGLVLAYLVYKSGSIFIAIIIHFINNTVVILSIHYPNGIMKNISEFLTIYTFKFDALKMIILVILSVFIILIGSKLLNDKCKSNSSGLNKAI
ncbi:ABC transporter permease subunit/CPBP intramembrane protease [Paraclostridium sordellii]|uniref:ABC transporter permease subunit/CPBP intramembrane protease n=1 Tax=Paraclostridium sordellii TaxID=1505 RepID=UPI001C61433A|nr:ABC transporter permease subunit/CPBP intramembrane protease [Paeniclostridium sordellii]QYE99791.1 ABC transporter permease [Paeniclostridium sordellii]